MRLDTLRFAIAILLVALCQPLLAAENWPCWRGPRGDGTCVEENIPTAWNGVTGENIAWKQKLPATGHSSPIVWGDRIFVTGCVESSGARDLLALDRVTGKLLWSETVVAAPLEKKHKLNSYASGTPATDGKFVYVTFLQLAENADGEKRPGEMVVAAYDFAGKQQWLVRPGRFSSVHGFCSSPVLFEDLVIVNGDHDGDSYIVALDRASGKTIWKEPRANKTRSYVTPIIREIDGRTQMLLSGSKCVTSYDPRTGKIHWSMEGPTQQFVASLVYDGDLLFLTAGFPDWHILAIKPDGHGPVGDEQIVWRTTKGCSYVPSPILASGHFLVAADNGIVSCFAPADGTRHWMERLGKHYSASAVTAGGLAYFLADDGEMKVIRPGEKLDVVATNPLGEYIYSSPAISQGQIFLRGEEHLVCVGKKEK